MSSALPAPPTVTWRERGVRVVRGCEGSAATGQTAGMHRLAYVTSASVGAQGLWGGTVEIAAGAATGAHHHGEVESVLFVLSGRARMRWGDALEFVAEAGPGDFIFVPPFVPHQEANASKDETLKCVIVRSTASAPGDAVIVNLPGLAPIDLGVAEWVDSVHPRGHTYADGGGQAHDHDHDHAHGHGHGHAHGHGPGPSP